MLLHFHAQKEITLTNPLPYFTHEFPGIGGRLKTVPEDFRVDEIPAYEPCGDGEHIFLHIEKRDISAEQLTKIVARALNISTREIGCAGLKDRRAITRQYLSVPATTEEHLPKIETEAVHILSAKRHRNKLKTGHLRGNRFTIVSRETVIPNEKNTSNEKNVSRETNKTNQTNQSRLQQAELIRDQIIANGFPNYFGTQRFGTNNNTLKTGFDLLRGDLSEKKIPFRRRRFLLRLALSAVQSHLFNALLAERISTNTMQKLSTGDVMQVVETGGLFIVGDTPNEIATSEITPEEIATKEIATEQHRLTIGETTITGPMFGPKMKQPTNEIAALEAKILEANNLQPSDFKKFPKLTPGTRRPLMIRPKTLTIETISEEEKEEESPEAIRITTELPPGTYATVLLREFMKNDAV